MSTIKEEMQKLYAEKLQQELKQEGYSQKEIASIALILLKNNMGNAVHNDSKADTRLKLIRTAEMLLNNK